MLLTSLRRDSAYTPAWDSPVREPSIRRPRTIPRQRARRRGGALSRPGHWRHDDRVQRHRGARAARGAGAESNGTRDGGRGAAGEAGDAGGPGDRAAPGRMTSKVATHAPTVRCSSISHNAVNARRSASAGGRRSHTSRTEIRRHHRDIQSYQRHRRCTSLEFPS